MSLFMRIPMLRPSIAAFPNSPKIATERSRPARDYDRPMTRFLLELSQRPQGVGRKA
jgi:hypothetical protein